MGLGQDFGNEGNLEIGWFEDRCKEHHWYQYLGEEKRGGSVWKFDLS
jgi:hypothetical protein